MKRDILKVGITRERLRLTFVNGDIRELEFESEEGICDFMSKFKKENWVAFEDARGSVEYFNTSAVRCMQWIE